MKGPVASVAVEKFSDQPEAVQDYIAVEEPLQIRVNGIDVAITMRTPGHDRELAAGFLVSEGILSRPDELTGIEDDGRGGALVRLAPGVEFSPESLTRNFYVTSSCGVCGKASIESLKAAGCGSLSFANLRLTGAAIRSMPAKLRAAQAAFDRTGGLHAAGLFDSVGNLIELREDVGRHNAVDKLIGAAFLNRELPLHNRVLMLSGRVSFELVQKALMAGIPAIAAVGAPSSLAVETAVRFGITLIGFLREDRFNIYAGSVEPQD